ncbi:condensation domain-containing protein, partial [Dokdonia sp.]
MKIEEYISSLRSKNIIISVQEERISVKASDEVITPEIIAELTDKKQEIIDFFRLVKKGKEFVSIPRASEESYYPLSSAQRRMYFLYEFDKASTTYNMPDFFRISRDLDVSQLAMVFKSLVARHQSLRTVFVIEEGQAVQRILDSS